MCCYYCLKTKQTVSSNSSFLQPICKLVMSFRRCHRARSVACGQPVLSAPGWIAGAHVKREPTFRVWLHVGGPQTCALNEPLTNYFLSSNSSLRIIDTIRNNAQICTWAVRMVRTLCSALCPLLLRSPGSRPMSSKYLHTAISPDIAAY